MWHAYQAVSRLVPDARPEARLTPYRRGGVEVIAGARRDPDFGPILLFGSGGVLAEAVGDVAIRTLPCAQAELEEMLEETRVAALLKGARGRPPVDRRALSLVLAGLARLILSVPEVADVEVNPLRCFADEIVALDTRALLA